MMSRYESLENKTRGTSGIPFITKSAEEPKIRPQAS